MNNITLFAVMLVFVYFASIVGITEGKRIGRELGYAECVEAVNSITYKTPNRTFNRGAESFKDYILDQIERYKEDRK